MSYGLGDISNLKLEKSDSLKTARLLAIGVKRHKADVRIALSKSHQSLLTQPTSRGILQWCSITVNMNGRSILNIRSGSGSGLSIG